MGVGSLMNTSKYLSDVLYLTFFMTKCTLLRHMAALLACNVQYDVIRAGVYIYTRNTWALLIPRSTRRCLAMMQ